MSQDIDYPAILAFLEAKRASLDKTISGVREILGLDAAGVAAVQVSPETPVRPATVPVGAVARAQDVTPGTFHGMSVSEAVRKFLEMTRQKQKMGEICEALRAGGIESTARNFYSNVYSTLLRQGAFIRLGTYWGLAEWYPNKATGAPMSPRKRRKKAKKAKAAKPTEKTQAKPEAKVEDAAGKAEPKAEPKVAENVKAFGKRKKASTASSASAQ